VPVRLASCSCGQLRAEVHEDPMVVSVCHCYACQRRTGSVFSTQAAFPREAAAIEGEGKEFVRVGDEGARFRFTFCPSSTGERTRNRPAPSASANAPCPPTHPTPYLLVVATVSWLQTQPPIYSRRTEAATLHPVSVSFRPALVSLWCHLFRGRTRASEVAHQGRDGGDKVDLAQ
jgi:hypothetical protein